MVQPLLVPISPPQPWPKTMAPRLPTKKKSPSESPQLSRVIAVAEDPRGPAWWKFFPLPLCLHHTEVTEVRGGKILIASAHYFPGEYKQLPLLLTWAGTIPSHIITNNPLPHLPCSACSWLRLGSISGLPFFLLAPERSRGAGEKSTALFSPGGLFLLISHWCSLWSYLENPGKP